MDKWVPDRAFGASGTTAECVALFLPWLLQLCAGRYELSRQIELHAFEQRTRGVAHFLCKAASASSSSWLVA
jgi:hypothetical protein